MALPYDPVSDLAKILETADYEVRHGRLPYLAEVIKRLRNGLGFEMEAGSVPHYEAALRRNLENAIPGTAAGKALTARRDEILKLRQRAAGLQAEVERRARQPVPGTGDLVTICPGIEHLGAVLAGCHDEPDGHVVRVPGFGDWTRDRLSASGWRNPE